MKKFAKLLALLMVLVLALAVFVACNGGGGESVRPVRVAVQQFRIAEEKCHSFDAAARRLLHSVACISAVACRGCVGAYVACDVPAFGSPSVKRGGVYLGA